MKISTLYSEAFTLTKKNAIVLIGTFLSLFAFSFLLNLISMALQTQVVALAIFQIINYGFQLYVGVALIKLMFLVVANQDLEFAQIKPKANELIQFLIAFVYMIVIFISIMMLTMGLLSLLTIIDQDFTSLIEKISLTPQAFLSLSSIQMTHLISILFLAIFPAMLVYLRLQFVTYLIVDKGINVIAAIFLSLAISKGKLGFILLIFGSILLLNVLGLLAFGIGLLFTIPMSFVLIMLCYKLFIKDFECAKASNNLNNN